VCIYQGVQEAEERAAAAAAALLEEEEEEEERPAAAKAARKSKRKKKKKGKQQGALPPPEQAPASPLEEPSESPDDTQVRFASISTSCKGCVAYEKLGGVNAAMRTLEDLISCSSSGITEGSTQCKG
jgi:hypothetical protein